MKQCSVAGPSYKKEKLVQMQLKCASLIRKAHRRQHAD